MTFNTSDPQGQQVPDLKHQVLSYIKENSVRPKPKWHFILALGISIFIIFLLSVLVCFAISVIFFKLRFSGALYALPFGFSGLRAFLFVFPWIWTIITLISIYAIDYLMRRFRFVYRKNILIFSVGLSIIFLLVGLGVERTRLHDSLAKPRQFIYSSELYGNGDDLNGIIVGRVMFMDDDTLILKTRSNRQLKVTISEVNPSRLERLSQGDIIVTLGRAEDGTFVAHDIRKTYSNFPGFDYPLPPPPSLRVR